MIDEFFGKIRYLGRLLDFDIEGNDVFSNFQEQLEVLDQDPGNISLLYSNSPLMEQLIFF